MWRLRTWIIIQTRGKNMLRCSSSPSVGFLGAKSGSVVGFEVSRLSFSEPIIVLLEFGIQFLEVVDGKRGTSLISGRHGECAVVQRCDAFQSSNPLEKVVQDEE